jgi:uncharacterized protein (TIGR02453 family)
MAYISKAYFDFFEQLAQNNNSEWFKAHKKDYEQHVKEPFSAMVADLLARLQKHDARLLGQEAKDCIFRINRDIRFAKDKSPYKLNAAAAISPGGKKSAMLGMYFHLGPNECWAGSGVYMPEPAQLKRIRDEIAYNPKEWEQLVSSKSFVQHFGAIQGETTVRAPKGYEDLVEKLPILKNKQYYFGADMDKKLVLSEALPEHLFTLYKASEPLNAFLSRAMQEG